MFIVCYFSGMLSWTQRSHATIILLTELQDIYIVWRLSEQKIKVYNPRKLSSRKRIKQQKYMERVHTGLSVDEYLITAIVKKSCQFSFSISMEVQCYNYWKISLNLQCWQFYLFNNGKLRERVFFVWFSSDSGHYFPSPLKCVSISVWWQRQTSTKHLIFIFPYKIRRQKLSTRFSRSVNNKYMTNHSFNQRDKLCHIVVNLMSSSWCNTFVVCISECSSIRFYYDRILTGARVNGDDNWMLIWQLWNSLHVAWARSCRKSMIMLETFKFIMNPQLSNTGQAIIVNERLTHGSVTPFNEFGGR